MTTQIQPATIFADIDNQMILQHGPGYFASINRFVAYPDGRYFATDSANGKWFGEGRGRAKFWPYIVTA